MTVPALPRVRQGPDDPTDSIASNMSVAVLPTTRKHKPFCNSDMTSQDGITDREFNAIRQLIYREAGISLSSAKRSLVHSRLARRLRELNLKSHTQYLEYLEKQDPQGVERQIMINCLTTNKTDFFREPHHFDFLRDVVFPQVRRNAAMGGPRELAIWSAACSMGDEPYTIAMTVLEHFGSIHGWNVRILATDINTEVLDTARSGIYAVDKIEMLSDSMKRKYFLRGTGEHSGMVRIRDEVKRLVSFRQLNLLDEPLQVRDQFDAIFCRNVIIYFDETTQRKLLPRFADRLKPQGHLMLGHSENVPWLTNQFEPLGGTVHQLKVTASTRVPLAPTPKPSVRERSSHPEMERVRLSRRHSLVAGETFASPDAVDVSTVLGSCIATCLYDPIAKIGGMNHFMLPVQEIGDQISARYGVHAMELLINGIMRLGGDRRRLKAKVFGGANVLTLGPDSPAIGQLNIEFIRHFLQLEQIPMIAEKVGGDRALRVHFHCHSGKAFVKPVPMAGGVLSSERHLALESLVQEASTATEQVVLF